VKNGHLQRERESFAGNCGVFLGRRIERDLGENGQDRKGVEECQRVIGSIE